MTKRAKAIDILIDRANTSKARRWRSLYRAYCRTEPENIRWKEFLGEIQPVVERTYQLRYHSEIITTQIRKSNIPGNHSSFP